MFMGNYLDHPTDTVDANVLIHGGKGENIDAYEILSLVYQLQLTGCCRSH